MRPQIGILGWGSLLWDERPDFDKQHDDWQFDGPLLKLEFSRVSSTRERALTLVVDETNGVDTTVAWCRSRRHELMDAVADLRCREGTTLANIGRLSVAETAAQELGAPERAIAAWARERRLDAVVWTGLSSNFQAEAGVLFSVAGAVAHLRDLTPLGKAKAAEYIRRAPTFIRTPLRTALEDEHWFVGQDDA